VNLVVDTGARRGASRRTDLCPGQVGGQKQAIQVAPVPSYCAPLFWLTIRRLLWAVTAGGMHGDAGPLLSVGGGVVGGGRM